LRRSQPPIRYRVGTGRVADLSPGLANFLGLDTDDQCEVTIDDRTSLSMVPDTHVIRFRRRQAHAFKKGRTLDGEPARIRNIVLHSSDGRESGDLATLTGDDVSAHWYVTRDGRIFHLVNDEDTAFHAGKVFKPQFFSNAATIGIEQEHFDPDPREGQPDNENWPDIQVETVAQVTAFLLEHTGWFRLTTLKLTRRSRFQKAESKILSAILLRNSSLWSMTILSSNGGRKRSE
jgi:N-acetylmuramoyl-L-alanine amidase-like protein